MKAPTLVDRLSALADPIRTRVLLVLEPRELTVGELRDVLQLPQSTVSRHLKVLLESGWISAREEGTSNCYRLDVRALDTAARRLWTAVREEAESQPAAQRDAQRVKAVLVERHSRSQAFFASTGAQWDKLRTDLFGARVELFALAGLLDATHVVGDLGCGTGALAEVMAAFAGRVIAVDESAAMLKAARARLGALPNVDVRRGTLETLPIDDATLDLAVVTLVLAYVDDPAAVLAEIRRTLRADCGRVLVVDMLPHDRVEYQQSMGHVRLGLAVDDLAQWGRAAGFRTMRSQPLPPAPQSRGPLLFTAVLST